MIVGGGTRLGLGRKGRSATDGTFRAVALATGLLVLVLLALIAGAMTVKAIPAFKHEGIGFIFSTDWNPSQEKFGALDLIYGTVVVSAIAIVLAVPVSVGMALFMVEYAPRWLRTPAVYVVDLLAAIPSVVFGLWGVVVFAPVLQDIYEWISRETADIPVVSTITGGAVSGRSFMTAGIIVAFMITPIVTSVTREVFATVPSNQKHAAWALGTTRWEMIRGSVFPHSRSGIVGAVLLGLGRAMGETIAVALVVGSSASLTLHLFESGDTMAAVIANSWGEANDLYRSALIGLGVVLFGLTIIVNLIAEWIVNRGLRRAGGIRS